MIGRQYNCCARRKDTRSGSHKRRERSWSIENAIGAKVLTVPNERRDEETREE